MPRAMIVAYADAVEAAVLSAQRALLMREIAVPACNCASGTWYSDGEKIAESIRGQQRRALLSYPAQERRRRTPEQWQHMYDQAMREKRKRTEQLLDTLVAE